MNNVTLRGRLTADPEIRNYMLKDGSTGTVAAFTLAVPDRTAKRDENNNFPADFIRCSCFGKNAEVMESFAMKGTEILITAGKLTSGSYVKDGVTCFTLEASISTFEFIGGTKSKEDKETSKESETKSNKK